MERGCEYVISQGSLVLMSAFGGEADLGNQGFQCQKRLTFD